MANDVRATLQHLIQEISGNYKTAGHNKVAEPLSEPGSLEGGTSHPSGKADDGTQTATTGSFAAEQTAAVKENVGATSVDSMPEATPGSVNQNDHQLNIGTKQSLIGEDPSSEDNYKETKDEPGNIDGKATTSPATVGDEKFASFSLPQKYAFLTKEANELLRDLTLSGVATTPTASNTPAAPNTPEAQAVAAGYKAAAAAAPAAISDADIQLFLQETVKEAEAIGDCAVAYFNEIYKAASEAPPEEAMETEDHDKPGDAGSNGDGAAPAGPAGGAAGGGGGDEDLALLAAMGGEGGGDPAAAPPAPPAPGGDMGGMPGGDPSLGGSSPVNELFNALVEMGITPDDLHQIADQMAGGAGGAGGAPGMPPGAGGPPPSDGLKIAAAKQAAKQVKLACRNGQTRLCETKTAQQRELRQRYKQALYDFVAR